MTELGYARGGFVIYDPGKYPNEKRVIPFRFNPESLTRTLQVEAGQGGGGVQGAAPRSGGGAAGPAAEAGDQSSGTIKQSFSVTMRLDFADRQESLTGFDEEDGILPEIAAIEDLLYPAEEEAQAASDGSDPVRVGAARPTVLFVWGPNRVLPVRIASLKIDETVYNGRLNPVRAEIEASLEVLGEADARDGNAVQAALEHTNKQRRALARSFHAHTAAQTSNSLNL